MNLLKSLSFLLIVLLLASCGKETGQELENEATTELVQNLTGKSFFLPLAIDQGTEEEIDAYLENMNTELHADLIEHTRIANYLGGIGKLKAVIETIDAEDILSVNKLEPHLTIKELGELEAFTNNENIDFRGCTAWQPAGCGCQYLFSLGVCIGTRNVCWETRKCSWWNVFKSERRAVNPGPIRYGDCSNGCGSA